MADELWEMLSGRVAGEIDDINRASLMNVTAGLVKSMLAQAQRGEAKPCIPTEGALRLLHQTATQFLLAKPGCYRDIEVHIEDADAVVFSGPPARRVKGLMRRFFRELAARWLSEDAVAIAAFVLWRLTWIHPFSDGNGRTAIAFAYACLCLKLGAWLPGRETIVDLIGAEPARCRQFLRVIDQTPASQADKPDLGPLKSYLDELLLRQMQPVQSEARGP